MLKEIGKLNEGTGMFTGVNFNLKIFYEPYDNLEDI